MKLAVSAILLCLAIPMTAAPSAVGAASRRVVVVVWDGMRPDFISAETTPNLWKFASEGVFFAHHHPVYLSATEVNGTAIATGAYPARSFVISNLDFRPRIDPQNAVHMEAPATIRRGDDVSGGRYIGVPTVAEILHARGWETAIAGSKPVALLHDRSLRSDGPGVSPIVYEGEALPPSLKPELTRVAGAFPPIVGDLDKSGRDRWTTRSLIETLWKGGVPPYSLLWLAEPDYSQHLTGPGSAQSLGAIKSSDTNFGLVLAELRKRGLLEGTDVFVVSDHGFSTIARIVDVAVEISKAGFRAKRTALGGLRTGEVMVVSNGGSSLLYVGGHDSEVCRRLAAFLQTQDWVGVIFSRQPCEGTFGLSEGHIDSPEAPDLVMSAHWTRDKSWTGAPGMLTSDLSSVKGGTHASLSAFDMHNTLVAAGPDIRRGVTDTLPSGNTDLAPTILWLLGLKNEAAKMDGRVLSEALTVAGPPLRGYEIKRLAAQHKTAAGVWTQYLQLSGVNGVRYLDEGNGAFVPNND